MNCDLCGIGEANVSVLPVDPKKILESYSWTYYFNIKIINKSIIYH